MTQQQVVNFGKELLKTERPITVIVLAILAVSNWMLKEELKDIKRDMIRVSEFRWQSIDAIELNRREQFVIQNQFKANNLEWHKDYPWPKAEDVMTDIDARRRRAYDP